MATNDPAPGTGEPSSEDPPPAAVNDPNVDELRAALRKAHKEAEATRLKLKEFEDRDKTEVERLQAEIAERDATIAALPGQTRAQVVRFASLASAAGFVDPEDALLNLGDVDLGDTEAVTAALGAIAERKPHLIRSDTSKLPPLPSRPNPVPVSAQELAQGSNPTVDASKATAAAALRSLSGSR